MPNDLTPADPEELRFIIGYALRFGDTGKPHRVAADDTARLAADIILRQLERSGYVVRQKPATSNPSVGHSRDIPLKP